MAHDRSRRSCHALSCGGVFAWHDRSVGSYRKQNAQPAVHHPPWTRPRPGASWPSRSNAELVRVTGLTTAHALVWSVLGQGRRRCRPRALSTISVCPYRTVVFGSPLKGGGLSAVPIFACPYPTGVRAQLPGETTVPFGYASRGYAARPPPGRSPAPSSANTPATERSRSPNGSTSGRKPTKPDPPTAPAVNPRKLIKCPPICCPSKEQHT
jgi:hypothetical protein